MKNIKLKVLVSNDRHETEYKIFEIFDQEAELNLEGNGILNLPDEIGQLIKLKRVDLSKNKLKDLPDEFWQLTNLVVTSEIFFVIEKCR